MFTGRREIDRAGRARRSGFTLVELLVSLAIMAVVFTIVWSTFSAVVNAWRRGGEVVDDIRHGDFVIDQLVSALRSSAYFPLKPDRYGFWLTDRGTQDEISWVTSGTSFMPPDSPLAQGVHRLMVSIEPNDDGEDAFTVRAFPHLAEEIDKDDAEAWSISPRVKGIDVRVWNAQDETWDDEWEDTNKIPGLIEVTLLMEPPGKYEPPVKIARLIQIPLGPATTGAVPAASAPAGGATPGGESAPAPGGSQPRAESGAAGAGQPRSQIISGQQR